MGFSKRQKVQELYLTQIYVIYAAAHSLDVPTEYVIVTQLLHLIGNKGHMKILAGLRLL